MSRTRRLGIVGILATVALQATACGPTVAPRSLSPSEVFTYGGADRQQVLEEGARREGKVFWYTSQIIDERAGPMANAFRAKYPFVNVEMVRLDSNELLVRTIEEYKAGRHEVDLVEATLTAVQGLKEAKVIAKFNTPAAEGLAKDAKDADGYFYADRENPLVLGYNTKVMPPGQAPTTFDDLLDPKYKGKMAIQDSNQSVQYIGALLTLKGEDFVRRLGRQDITVYPSSGRAILDLVVAGEVPMSFPVSIAHTALLAAQGAPVGSVTFEKVPTVSGYVALASQAPHPYATALFADFVLSDDGQRVMVGTQMGSARKTVKNPYPEFPKLYVDAIVPADRYRAEYTKWSDLYKEVILKKR